MNLRTLVAASLAAATAAGCAVKLNGKTYGGGGGGGSSGASASGGGGTTAPVSVGRGVVMDTASNAYQVAHAAGKARKPPAAPADPWAAVDGDRPRLTPEPAYYFASTTPNDCSAAHDHCLPADIWFVEDHQKVKELERTLSAQQYRGLDPDNKFSDSPWVPFARASWVGAKDVAHRTVPATRRHLVKGALAIALPYPDQAPTSEEDASSSWVGGIVDSIDWDAGKVQLVGHKTLLWISATRVVVLTYSPGGKVEVRGKLDRDQLAVRAGETIAPMVDRGTVAAPWAEVGKDGQPNQPTDRIALERTETVPCDAAHDHCLRPWVWFVEDHRGAWAVRFHGGAFHRFSDVDDLGDAEHGAAFRTVPADPATLAKGTHVIFRDGQPSAEHDAHGEWHAGELTEVQVEAGVFRVKGDDRYYRIEHARVPVVMWFPGEKAASVE